MRAFATFLLAPVVGLLLEGCLPSVTLPNDRLPDLIALGEGKPLEVEAEGERVLVTPEMSPQVEVDDGAWGKSIVAVESMRLEDGVLHLPGPFFGLGEKEVAVAEIRSLRLQWDPPERRPQVGVGMTLLGPAGLGGISFHWLPVRWVGLEFGSLTDPRSGILNWIGGRLRPVAIGPVLPFVGVFGHASLWGTDIFDPDSPPARAVFTYGGRLGVDLALSRHFLLLLEVDFARTSRPSEALFPGEGREWIPMGGVTAIYLL